MEDDFEEESVENSEMINEEKTTEEPVKKKRPYNRKKRPKEMEDEINL